MIKFDPGIFITILVGLLRSGKTWAALDLAEGSGLPTVILVPSPRTANERLRKIPFVRFSRLSSYKKTLEQMAQENGKIRLVLDRDASGQLNMPAILAALEFPAFQIWDDFPSLLIENGEKKAFAVWSTLVRHNRVFICITTQRVAAEIPPLIRTIVGAIYAVGAMPLQDETRYLFTQTNLTTVENWEEFHQKLKENPARHPFMVRG